MILSMQDVHKSYQQGEVVIEVLKGLSLEVSAGETLAIIGESGAGKSTFLSLVAGLDRPSRGQIHLLGQEISQMEEERLTEYRGQHIGIVFQHYHLLPHLSAWENVMLPMEILRQKGDLKAPAIQALVDVGLAQRINHFPSQLSGGECQRVAIARALITRPQLLLADEPSGNLDGATGELVMELLFKLVEKNHMTVLLVTHNQELAQRCQGQMLLKDGKLFHRSQP